MTKKITPEEMRGVLAADGPTRYSHFIKEVVDWESIWGLREPDGWVGVSDDSGVSMFPLWPHRDYAALLAVDDWSGAIPTPISLDDWLDEWLVNLTENGDQIAVFPTSALRGVVVSPE